MKAPLPPGPNSAFLGVLKENREDPLTLYEDCWKTYGDVVRLGMLGGLVGFVSVADPDGVEHVLARNHANYSRPRPLLAAIRSVGEGLFTSEGATWKRMRKLVGPSFRRDRLVDMVPGIVSVAEEHAAAWARPDLEQPWDILDDLSYLTLDVASSVFFGTDLGEDREPFAAALREALAQISDRLSSVVNLPLWIPTRRNRDLLAARDTLHKAVERILDARLAKGPSGAANLLERLLAVRDENGEALSRKEVDDEMGTFLIAGHDTSAAGLAWTLHLLAENPTVLADVQAEIDRVLGGRSPTADDLPKLELTRMAFEESLRLYSPSWGMGRQALGPDVVCGYRIPRGTVVLTMQFLAHRHPKHWDDPERFDPLRFTRERSAGRHPFAYFPFGAGPRMCIGRQLALLEVPLLLAVLLSRFTFESSDVPVEPDATFTLRPRRLVMRAVRRGAPRGEPRAPRGAEPLPQGA